MSRIREIIGALTLGLPITIMAIIGYMFFLLEGIWAWAYIKTKIKFFKKLYSFCKWCKEGIITAVNAIPNCYVNMVAKFMGLS